jgi:hypothetical protein
VLAQRARERGCMLLPVFTEGGSMVQSVLTARADREA